MVFFNNNRVDHIFYNNANIIAIGMGTNNAALVYNNAATKAYVTAVGGRDNHVDGFEIVNFNTLGLNNIDLRIPYQSTTSLMNRSAAIYYNNARNNCLIESTVKDIDISGLVDYSFGGTNFASLSLNSLTVGDSGSSNPGGYFTAKYVVCNARHGGSEPSSPARWAAVENLTGKPLGRTPGHSNMFAGNVMSLNGDYCFFSQYTGFTVDQLNITGAKTLYLNNFNGGSYWEANGGIRVLYGVTNANVQNCRNICTVNANNVYVNASSNINYINGNYVQLGNKVAHYSVSNVRNVICYNLSSYGSDIRANVSYFADVDLSTTLSNVTLYANHANINGGFYVNANLYSNNASSYINNTATGRFILNHNTYLENVRNSNVFMLGEANLSRVNNCRNSTFWLRGTQANIYNTYNAFRDSTIYLHENSNVFAWGQVSALTRKDAFFNAAIYNANVTNMAVLVNYGPKTFNWYSYTDPAIFAEEFSYSAVPYVTNASSNARVYLNVRLPCGSNINGTCLVLGNAYNVSSYELRQEVHIGPRGTYPNNGGNSRFGWYAYISQNGHDTYIHSSNMNNFNNRKFIITGLGDGSVSYPNGKVAYIDAPNTVLLRFMVPNTYVYNAYMVQIPFGANPLNNNYVLFDNCGPVYIEHTSYNTEYAFRNMPNACIAGGGQFYVYSNMNIATYNTYVKNFWVPDNVGEVHFDVKGFPNTYSRLGNIKLYNTGTSWNKNTSIFINAFDVTSPQVFTLSQFIFQNMNINNAKTIEVRMNNCIVGDFNANGDFYFSNTNVYIWDSTLYSASTSATINIFTEYPSKFVFTNVKAQTPTTFVKGTNVNITLNNCTNITVM